MLRHKMAAFLPNNVEELVVDQVVHDVVWVWKFLSILKDLSALKKELNRKIERAGTKRGSSIIT